VVRSIANAYRDAYGGLPREVWILSFALFINRCGAMVLAFLTLYLTEKLHFSILDAGLIFSIYGAGSFVGVFLGGKLVKPFGAVRTQIVALIVAVPLYLIIPLFTSWWLVAVAAFFCSLFTESVRPANMVAVSQFTSPELTTRAFGLQRMAVNLGFSIGPAVGGILATFNYHWLFLVDGITTGLAGLTLLWYFGFQKYVKNDAAAEKQKAAEQVSTGASPLGDGRYFCFLALLLLVALVFFQFHATYPKFLADHYLLTEFQIGIMFSINTIIIVVFEMLLLNKVRAFPLLKMIGWGSLLACFGFGILPFGVTFLFCAFSMTIITLGEMFMFPLCSSYVAERSRGKDQGMYMSAYSMMYSIAVIIAPAVGTTIYQSNPNWIWYGSFAVGMVALVGFYVMAAQDEPVDGEESAVKVEENALELVDV